MKRNNSSGYIYLKDRLEQLGIEGINTKCPCGHEIIVTNDTIMKCEYYNCPEHLAQRLNKLREYLGVKGIGIEYCRSLCKSKGFENHFEAIPYLFKGQLKPKIPIMKLAEFCFIEGKSTEWSELIGLKSVDALPADYIYLKELKEASKYFEVEYSYGKLIPIMLTGQLSQWSRDGYLRMLNKVFAGIYVFQDNKKKIEGTFALVTDTPGSNSDKNKRVKEHNAKSKKQIPIFTGNEFLGLLANFVVQKGIVSMDILQERMR